MDSNVIAALGAAVTTGIFLVGVNLLSKKWDIRSKIAADARDDRAKAEIALLGIGPQIIQQQNERIDQLSRDLDTLWARERECREELRAMDRRYRHFVSSLLMQMMALRRLLQKVGTQLPPISGLDVFIEEGGMPREEWVRAIKEDESG